MGTDPAQGRGRHTIRRLRRGAGGRAEGARRHPGDLRRQQPYAQRVRPFRGRRATRSSRRRCSTAPSRTSSSATTRTTWRAGRALRAKVPEARHARRCGGRGRASRRQERPASSAIAGAARSPGGAPRASTDSRRRSAGTAAASPATRTRSRTARCSSISARRTRGIPLTDVEAIRAAQPEVEVFVYPGAGHGFGCDDRGSFDRASLRARPEAHAGVLRQKPLRAGLRWGQDGWVWREAGTACFVKEASRKRTARPSICALVSQQKAI